MTRALLPVALAVGLVSCATTPAAPSAAASLEPTDDFTTQPTGNSGARVACGVIRKS